MRIDERALQELDKESLITIILELREVIEMQTARIQVLEDQRAKTSQNSGKPPSSDGLKKPSPKSLRERGKRSNGGQKGHKGHTLEMVAEPNQVTYHAVEQCPHCQTDLRAVEVDGIEKRQVFDVPAIQLEVNEHQAEIKGCPGCGEQVKGTFPSGVTQSVQYGIGLKAQAAYVNTYQLLPVKRICELFADFYGHAPSQALILSASSSLVEQITPVLQVIRKQLSVAEVVHCDESGLRVAGKLNWLHVVGTPTLTYHHLHHKRGQEAMRDMGILPIFAGYAVHDGWASYFQFENCHHALGNAHHLRELQFVVEQYQQGWAQDMTHLLLDIKAEVKASRANTMTLPPQRIAYYQRRYEEGLQAGFAQNPLPQPPLSPKRGRKKQSPPRNLLDRLDKYRAATLAFMSDFRVPFDNNLAERDVRMMKVKQKISGAFRTRCGAETFCALRSYISTVRKQGIPVIQAIYDALLGQPFMPTAHG